MTIEELTPLIDELTAAVDLSNKIQGVSLVFFGVLVGLVFMAGFWRWF